MNIEHEYFEKIGKYEPFEGICFVDSFERAKKGQGSLLVLTTANTERIEKQRATPITVVIGNPPYNVGQLNENDNNKNRKYEEIDLRVSQTYSVDSNASNKNSLSDPYVKAIRWATDEIHEDGIVAFVTNNGFLNGIAFDGMRKHLEEDFSSIYHINLKGNARTSGERRRQEGGNVFDDLIRVSVGITFLIKKDVDMKQPAEIFIYEFADYLKSLKKKELLEGFGELQNVPVKQIIPDLKHNWLTEGMKAEFESFISMGTKQSRASQRTDEKVIFKVFSNGNDSGRDDWVYNFGRAELISHSKLFADTYNAEVDRYQRSGRPANIDDFVVYDDRKIKWTRNAKRDLRIGRLIQLSEDNVKEALYRPYSKQFHTSGKIFNKEVAQIPRIFPDDSSSKINRALCLTSIGNTKSFQCLMVNITPDLHLTGDSQCFSFYIYDSDGTNRRENITDWAVEQFRGHYGSVPPAVAGGLSRPIDAPGVLDTQLQPPVTAGGSDKITKWDIFYYTYAILHHPEYREKYAANLKRELPRIPFAPDFWAFAKAGKELADIHVNYEGQPEYKLEMIENGKLLLDWKVEKMRYNKEKTAIVYNDFLTIAGIPPEVHEYRLGNRSALDWIVDQYKVSIDKRSGIVNDPNREDEPQYIVRLIKKIVTVSLRTNEIVSSLPDL